MAAYYVRSDADAGGDGTTTNTTGGTCAWNSIAQVNAKNFSSGDIVYFRPGDTFDDDDLDLAGVSSAITGITLTSSDFGGKTVASDGLPWFDHNTIYTYIQNSNISNLTVKDLEFSGNGINTTKLYNLRVNNIENIVVDGVYIDGSRGTLVANSNGQSGIGFMSSCSGTVEVKNCEVFNLGPTDGTGALDIPSSAADSIGLVFFSSTNVTAYVHDNAIHDVNADCVQIYNCPSSSLNQFYIYDNDFYNAGEDCIDIKGASNVEVYSNNFYRANGFTGQGGSGGILDCVLIHQCNQSSTTYENISVHDNNFYDCPDVKGVYCNSDSDEEYTGVKIYNNIFNNTDIAIYFGVYMPAIQIFNNVILNPDDTGIYTNTNESDGKITNNTIIRGTGSATHAINLAGIGGGIVKNNLIDWNYAGPALTRGTYGTDPTIENNIWHNAGSVSKIDWKGTIYNESNWATWTASHPGESYADPKTLSTGRLESVSPALGAGVIVAGVNDVGILDIWGNSNNDSPNIGADLGSDQNTISIDIGFAFNETSYDVRITE